MDIKGALNKISIAGTILVVDHSELSVVASNFVKALPTKLKRNYQSEE